MGKAHTSCAKSQPCFLVTTQTKQQVTYFMTYRNKSKAQMSVHSVLLVVWPGLPNPLTSVSILRFGLLILKAQ